VAEVESVHQTIHVGAGHESVQVSNVSQSNVVQVQQVAVVPYVQVVGLVPVPKVPPPRSSSPYRMTTRRPPPFATSLTDPNNPWGFDFPPTVLVK
jgi:hypothetical protein